MNQPSVTNELDPYRERRFLRSRGKFFAIGAVLLLPLFSFYGLRRLEWAATFHPQPYRSGDYWKLPAGTEDVDFMTTDRVRLHGWFIRSQVQPARAAIIYFHGNSGNIGSLGWLGESLAAREFDVLLFDYRGYGRSEGQIRDEYDMYKDADAAYRYVISRAPAPIERIVLYGQSLGTAAATDLASREKCGALIVESGLSSASDMAQVMAPWLPRWLNRFGQNRFDSKGKLPRVHCPVLISHGGSDDVAPASQGLALFASANEPKRLILAPEAGHNMFGHGGDEYMNQVAAFIREAVNPPSASPTAARQ